MFDVILFDLDGTLTDPGIGITNSVMYALKKFGIEVNDRSELYKFIGPPLLESFRKYYGFSEEESQLGLKYYREYFRDRGIFENQVYEGVPELLQKLRADGKKLCLATSKPDEFSVRILKHFDLFEYFDFIGAATMDEKRTKKSEVIDYVLKENGFADQEKILMVGDRDQDMRGAKANGLHALGVLYGYGSEEELSEAGAWRLAKDPEEVYKIISQSSSI